MKTDPVSGIDQSPANIHVIASRPELIIESFNGVEGFAADREIATGKVLGFDVIQQYVSGAAGSGSDHGTGATGWRRRNIGASRRGEIVFGKGQRQPGEPVGIGFTIIVGVSNDLARR
jgi:hypothetical protein